MEISVFDLGLCFRKLRKVTSTDVIYYHVEHPSVPDEKLEFMLCIDYSNNKRIWRLTSDVDIVSDYE